MTASASAAAALSCTATPSYPGAWSGGFEFEVSVANTGTEAFNTWVVTFDVPPGYFVEYVFNGQATQSGQHVIVRGGGHGEAVPPGASILAFGGIVQGTNPGGLTNLTCTAGIVP